MSHFSHFHFYFKKIGLLDRVSFINERMAQENILLEAACETTTIVRHCDNYELIEADRPHINAKYGRIGCPTAPSRSPLSWTESLISPLSISSRGRLGQFLRNSN